MVLSTNDFIGLLNPETARHSYNIVLTLGHRLRPYSNIKTVSNQHLVFDRSSADTIRRSDDYLVLGQCRGRWASVKPTLWLRQESGGD